MILRSVLVAALVCAAELSAAKTPSHQAAGRTDEPPAPPFLLQMQRSSADTHGRANSTSNNKARQRTEASILAQAAAKAKVERELRTIEQALTLDFEAFMAKIEAMTHVEHWFHKQSHEVETVLNKRLEAEEEGGEKKGGKGLAAIQEAMEKSGQGGRRPRKTDKVQALLQAKLVAKANAAPTGFVQVGDEKHHLRHRVFVQFMVSKNKVRNKNKKSASEAESESTEGKAESETIGKHKKRSHKHKKKTVHARSRHGKKKIKDSNHEDDLAEATGWFSGIAGGLTDNTHHSFVQLFSSSAMKTMHRLKKEEVFHKHHLAKARRKTLYRQKQAQKAKDDRLKQKKLSQTYHKRKKKRKAKPFYATHHDSL